MAAWRGRWRVWTRGSRPETTVLFSDIAGFTAWVGRTDPDRVVSLLDDLFA